MGGGYQFAGSRWESYLLPADQTIDPILELLEC